MGPDVVLAACPDYQEDTVERALLQALEPLGGLNWVKPGMKIALKPNLVSFLKPERAATTHPSLLCVLTRLLTASGAQVVVGDSPGGLYTAAYVNRVYAAAGMRAVEGCGGRLNQDFSQHEVRFPQGSVCREFCCTGWLDGADAVIDVCKLKTHGMMAMSCAAKNMFGIIPGTMKPEYHFRYPDPRDFARMIVDLNEYIRPRLTLVDAVECMEGNGPTGGTPRHMGLLAAGESPHKVDLACAVLIGLSREEVPTLEAALERGLIPERAEELNISGKLSDFTAADFKRIITGNSHLFRGDGKHLSSRLTGALLDSLLSQRPAVDRRSCVGCGQCRDICPGKAITMRGGLPVIDRRSCIRCFCCQEFCPKSAMKVRRTAVARLLDGGK